MKEWTREEVERLVPEWRMSVFGDGDFAGFNDGNRKSIPEMKIIDALLQTRLDLEVAKELNQEMRESQFAMNCEIIRLRGALERIMKEGSTWVNNECGIWLVRLAREALKATK